MRNGQKKSSLVDVCWLVVARQRVKEQIAKDRAEKAARDKAEKAAREAAASGGGVGAANSSTSPTGIGNPAASSQPKKDYDTCRLQVRWQSIVMVPPSCHGDSQVQ